MELSPRAGREACSQGAGGTGVTALPGQGLHAGTWAQQQKQPPAHGLGAGGGPELNPGPRTLEREGQAGAVWRLL